MRTTEEQNHIDACHTREDTHTMLRAIGLELTSRQMWVYAHGIVGLFEECRPSTDALRRAYRVAEKQYREIESKIRADL